MKREPSAEMRVLAATMRQMYLALVDEGFTASEAMEIIGYTLHAANGNSDG